MLGITGLDPHRMPDSSIWSHVHKFGSNPTIGASEESVWSAGGLYPWSSLDSAQTLYVSSDDASDDGSVYVQGLDANCNLISESVSLNVSPPQATTTNTYKRVYRMEYNGSAGATNAGLITARTVSHSGTIVAQIDAEKSQTLMSVYTVPNNHTGHIVCYTASVGKLDDAAIFLYVREKGTGSFRLKSEMNIYQSTATQHFAVPLDFPAKSDIDFRATGSTGNSSCIVNFDIVLRKLERV